MSGICDAFKDILGNTRDIPNPILDELRWDKTKITDDILSQIAKGVNIDLASIIPNATARDKIKFKPKINGNSVLAEFENQRAVTLGLNLVLDTISSITDIANNNNVDITEISSNIDEKTSSINLPYAHVCQVLARKYLNSANMKIVKGSPEFVANKEFELGQQLLEALINKGILVKSRGKVPNNKHRDKDSNVIKDTTIEMNIVYLNPHMINDDTIHHANTVSRLLNPTREILPYTEANPTVDFNLSKAHGVTLTNGQSETFSLLGRGKRLIHPLFAGIIQELASYDSNDISSRDSLNLKLSGYPALANEVFGMELMKTTYSWTISPTYAQAKEGQLPKDYTDLAYLGGDLKTSQLGQIRTKSSNIINVLDNVSNLINEDGSSKDLHFNYFGFRSGRSLANQNILNAQTDKHFARAVTASEPVTVSKDSIAFQKVIGALVDDYKFTELNQIKIGNQIDLQKVNEILNSAEFTTFKEMFIDDNPNEAIPKLNAMLNTPSTYIKKSDSLFDKIKGIALAYEVLTGLANTSSNEVVISHDVAPDAHGSGLFINMLQALSNGNKAVIDMFTSLGFLPDKDGKYTALYSSIYNVVSDQLVQEIKLATKPGSTNIPPFANDYVLITSLVPDLNERELAKMPIMTMGTYNQSDWNATKGLSSEIATQIIEAAQRDTIVLTDEVRAMLLQGLALSKNKSITPAQINEAIYLSDITRLLGSKSILEAYFNREHGISRTLISRTNDRIKNVLFKQDLNYIKNIYNEIDTHIKNNNLNPADLKILPPQVLFDLDLSMDNVMQMSQEQLSELTKKYGLPLTKLSETIQDNETIILKESMNLPSFVVSTTHMIDGAEQHLSLNMSIKEYYQKYGKYPGVVPIHDADNSDPLFAEIQDQNYIKAVLEVNEKYNKVQMLILSAKAIGISIDNNSTLKAIADSLPDMNTKRAEQINLIRTSLNQSQYENSAKVYGYKQTTKFNPLDLNNYLGLQDLTKLSPVYIKMYSDIVEFINTNPEIKLNFEGTGFYWHSNDVIDVDKSNSVENKIKFLHHEIIHSNTAEYIDDNINSNEVQYLKAVTAKLKDKLPEISKIINQLYGESSDVFIDADNKLLSKADYLIDRFNYMLQSTDNNKNLKESVAILVAEPDVQEAFVDVLNKLYPKENSFLGNLTQVIKSIVRKIKSFIVSDKMLKKVNDPLSGVRSLQTLQVVHKINDLGKLAKQQNKFNLNTEPGETEILGAGTQAQSARTIANNYKEYLGSNTLNDPFSTGTAILNQYARAAIMLSLESYGKSLYDGYLTKGHISMMRNSPIYREVVELLQDARQNRHIQQIIRYMNLDNFKDRVTLTKMLALFNDAVKERNKIDSTYIRNLSDKLEVNFNTSEIAEINTVYAKTGIFSLTHNSTILLDLLANDPKVKDDKTFLNEYINKYVKDNNITLDEKLKANGLAELYVHSKVDGRIHTDNIRAYSSDKTRAYVLETLASLYALDISDGLSVIRKVQEKSPEIHSELVQVAVGIKTILTKLENKLRSTEAPITANIVGDVYKNNYQVIAVDLASYNKGNYNEDWQVLRKPSPGKLGLVYRQNINTAQPGLGTNNNFSVDGLVLDKYLAGKYTDNVGNNAVSIYMGKEQATKILFTQEEKVKLGLVENPAQSLYRTYSHLLFLHDTQGLRDTLISKAFTKEINDKVKDAKSLIDDIKNPDQEHSWFLKLNGSVAFNDLPKEIREKYEPVNNITNLGQMASHITHVRKDIAPQLVGYSEPEIVSKNYKLNRLANIFKKLVAMQKIHWVIVNPTKIAKDAISNFTYLISRNISVLKVYSYGKEVMKALPELNTLRNELVAAKLFADADPMNKAKQDKVISAQKAISNHKFAFIIKNGYVSSLSTDLILKDSAAVTGLENDIENFLNKIVRDNKGDLNSIGKFISRVGKMGVSTEDALNVVSGLLSKTDMTKGTSELIDSVSNELVRIKEKEDVAKYLMQFIAAPGSEAVKIGSASIQSIEVVSKAILHMHMKDIGKTEDEAIQDVTDSFFDYTANMPESMKLLSDYSVLLFPTFWARVQRVIILLGRDQPVSLASAFLISEMLGIDSTHIIGSNLISKADNGSILNSPEVTTDAFYASGIT